MKYETKHAIGDVVYLATASDIDRRIIKYIKLSGLKAKASYGFERSTGSMFSLFYGNSESWYDGANLFVSQEDAEKRQAVLKAREAEKAEAEDAKELIDMERKLKVDQENLRRKKKGLPLLTDDEDYDD